MDDRQNTVAAARRILLQRLESLQLAGVEQFPRGAGVSAAVTASGSIEPQRALHEPAAQSAIRNPQSAIAQSPSPAPPLSHSLPAPSMLSALTQAYPADLPVSVADRQKLLDELNTNVRSCSLCRELACTRKQTVFGVGHVKPRVAFFGEAPGADEDRQGEPFVGRAGQLLTKIIEACGWKRSDVYIMNVLKCRPPDNRTPLPTEVENCRPFFERQFEILRPEYIVCAGGVAAQALLETTDPVGRLRGRFHRYRDSKVLVTYHPSYLLRNPSAKKQVWDDMQMLLKEMGLPVPGRQQ